MSLPSFKKNPETDISFNELFRVHGDMVYRVCLRYTGKELDAKDLAQEVFIRVYQKKKSFTGSSSWLTWIYRVAVNVCIDHLRVVNRRKRIMNDSKKQMALKSICYPTEPCIAEQTLAKIFEEVDEKTQSLLFMIYGEGLTHSEAAKLLDVSRAAISLKLKRFKEGMEVRFNRKKDEKK